MTGHHPLHCILPPAMLEQIARNGSTAQRDRALTTLSIDHSLRAERAHPPLLQRSAGRSLADAADPNAQRSIYDAKETESLPGVLVRSEGQAKTGDAAADEAYDGLGDTFDLYNDVYGRDSIDDDGLPLTATVHFGHKYDNAFWNSTQMVFGDGDGELFNRFTISVDVIGHELTHGVTEDEAALVYLRQSGALNESVSDVFGSLVKQYKAKQSASDADWLIGEGLFTKNVQGVALRSMKAPGTAYDDDVLGKDPQPAHMRDYVTTFSDNGGVHINSGIPNHAFYLAAIALGGNAWEKAGHIWYDALRDPKIKPTARFRTFARATVRAAQNAFGSADAKTVTEAWDQVGITV